MHSLCVQCLGCWPSHSVPYNVRFIGETALKKITQSMFFVLSLPIIFLISGCASGSTPVVLDPLPENTSQPDPESTAPAEQSLSDSPYSIAEVEQLAGFDVKEPAYLPKGVTFDFATYQEQPSPNVTLYFKIVHEQYGDMGIFFQIMQEPQAEAPAVSCGESVEGCETLQLGGLAVVYHLNDSGTEGLDWYADGFSFRLLRTAGEPNKIYKDELIKIVESTK